MHLVYKNCFELVCLESFFVSGILLYFPDTIGFILQPTEEFRDFFLTIDNRFSRFFPWPIEEIYTILKQPAEEFFNFFRRSTAEFLDFFERLNVDFCNSFLATDWRIFRYYFSTNWWKLLFPFFSYDQLAKLVGCFSYVDGWISHILPVGDRRISLIFLVNSWTNF